MPLSSALRPGRAASRADGGASDLLQRILQKVSVKATEGGLRAPRPFAQSSATRQPGSTSGYNRRVLELLPRMTALRGQALLADPRLNKQSAFSDSEREELGLRVCCHSGWRPSTSSCCGCAASCQNSPASWPRTFLRELHDRNETLFCTGCSSRTCRTHADRLHTHGRGGDPEYSHAFRRPRGCICNPVGPMTYRRPSPICSSVQTTWTHRGHRPRGDPRHRGLGVGGIDIAIGKISVYVAAAGWIRNARFLSCWMGTDRTGLLTDPGTSARNTPGCAVSSTTR